MKIFVLGSQHCFFKKENAKKHMIIVRQKYLFFILPFQVQPSSMILVFLFEFQCNSSKTLMPQQGWIA